MLGQLSWKKGMIAFAMMVLIGSPTAMAKPSFSGEYRQGEILSFGASLNKKEETTLREDFGVTSDMAAIYVDNATAIEQLGLAPNALENYTGGWYSSAYVKLTSGGGVQVTSKNVSLVTNEMFTNALITSGITNAEVKVSAPFMVTGESALAGILAGAEEIMGESLSEENKVVAKEEIDTTLDLADEILNNENNEITNTGDSSNVASGIINEIKQQVIKDSPNSTQIQEIIINVTNNYGVELTPETNARVLSLMEEVNELDIDYSDIEETMNNIGDKISDSLKEAGIKLKESGLLEKIGDWFKDFGNWILDFGRQVWSWITGGSEASESLEENVTLIPSDEELEILPSDDEQAQPEMEEVETPENGISPENPELEADEIPNEEPVTEEPQAEMEESEEMKNIEESHSEGEVKEQVEQPNEEAPSNEIVE